MRFLRTHVGNCVTHPTATIHGDPGGEIRCSVCGKTIGQWNLTWQPLWVIAVENIMARMVARTLPPSVVRWALRRAITHATQPRWGDATEQTAATITAHDVALRWELDAPDARLDHLPEWMREYMEA